MANLVRFNSDDFDGHVGTPLDEWVYMMKNGEVEPDFTSSHIQDAGERLKYISLKEKERQEYDRYLENLHYQASMEETRQTDMEMAIAEGREEEKRIQQVAIARKALQMGLSASQIAEMTSLHEAEITQLQDE